MVILYNRRCIVMRRRLLILRGRTLRLRKAMVDTICRWWVAVVATMLHVLQRRRRRAVWCRTRWIRPRMSRRSGRALLLRGIVRIGSIHGSRSGMLGVVALVVRVVVLAVSQLVRWLLRMSKGREVLRVGRRTGRRIWLLDWR